MNVMNPRFRPSTSSGRTAILAFMRISTEPSWPANPDPERLLHFTQNCPQTGIHPRFTAFFSGKFGTVEVSLKV
jgi:hypothetical protein